MPLLDTRLYSVRFQRVYDVPFLFSKENTARLGYSRRHFSIPNSNRAINTGSCVIRRGCGLRIKVVATIKENGNVQQVGIDSTIQSSSEDSTLDEKQRLIRMKISKAMKGKTPWNKGRKHSPETLQRIRERTKIAMQDPKIRMKVAVNLGQTLSEETKTKIKARVRLHLERLREKRTVQEACHFEWQNLIAEASRKGLCGEQELQWDSYQIIDKQLGEEWIQSIEHRKKNRPKGFKRGPLSPERKRKLSQILSAKWEADPSYRDRVYSGLSKYYGKTVGIGKPRKSQGTKLLIAEDDALENAAARDPMAQPSKTETRETNADPESQAKREAIERTKLLIAEARRSVAAKEKEIGATNDPIAEAQVIETRKLIAKAIRFIQSMEATSREQGLATPSDDHLGLVPLSNTSKKTKRWVRGKLVEDD